MVNERDTQYLLLTPGPLSTTRTVREAMMQEFSTWDVDYNSIIQSIRERLVRLATDDDAHTAALMPGSGTFAVESVIGSVIPPDGKLLVLNNGAYGARITKISQMLGINTVELGQAEMERFLGGDMMASVSAQIRDAGFADVTLDTKGYRRGSLNEGVALAKG